MTRISVDLVSDPVCPWCWLGHRYWKQACDSLTGIDVETVYRPFQLDPSIPAEGVAYQDYMKAKFAGQQSDQWQSMRDHLETAGPEVGLAFQFDEIKHRPNTMNAHRVIRWAQGQSEKQASLVTEALFKAYFQTLEDIGDQKVLSRIAGQAGLDAQVIGDLLQSDKDLGEVRQEEQFYRNLGVTGVPCFIFNGRFAIAGAQGPEVLAKAIEEAASAPATNDQ